MPPTARQKAAGEPGTHTGKWLARIKGSDGRTTQLRVCNTLRDAKALIVKEVDRINSAAPDGHLTNKSVVQLMADWPGQADMHPMTVSTNKERVRRVLRHVDPVLPYGQGSVPVDVHGDVTVGGLTVGVMERARRSMMDAGLARKTIDDSFASLSRLLRGLAKDDATVLDVANGVRVPPRPRNYAPRAHRAFRAVPREEVQNFVADYVAPEDAGVFWASAVTGCRTGELLALNLRNHDADAETMRLRETVNKHGMLEDGLKTTHSLDPGRDRSRLTLFPQALADLLSRRARPIDGYLLRAPGGQFYTVRDFHRYVWGDPYPPSKPAYWGPMTSYERDGGQRFTPNDLRHTFSTWLTEDAAIPHWIVDTWLGHKDRRLDEMLGAAERDRRSVLDRVYLHETGLRRPEANQFLSKVIRGEDVGYSPAIIGGGRPPHR